MIEKTPTSLASSSLASTPEPIFPPLKELNCSDDEILLPNMKRKAQKRPQCASQKPQKNTKSDVTPKKRVIPSVIPRRSRRTSIVQLESLNTRLNELNYSDDKIALPNLKRKAEKKPHHAAEKRHKPSDQDETVNLLPNPKSYAALKKFVIPKLSHKTKDNQLEKPSAIVVRREISSTQPVKDSSIDMNKNTTGHDKIGILEMENLVAYLIPIDLWDIENGQILDQKVLERLKWIKSYARKSQEQYINAFKTLLHLEESAQSKSLQSLSKRNVTLKFSVSLKLFFIKNDVSAFPNV